MDYPLHIKRLTSGQKASVTRTLKKTIPTDKTPNKRTFKDFSVANIQKVLDSQTTKKATASAKKNIQKPVAIKKASVNDLDARKKAGLLRVLKKEYPTTTKPNKRTLANFTNAQIQNTMLHKQSRDQLKKERQDRWAKVTAVQYAKQLKDDTKKQNLAKFKTYKDVSNENLRRLETNQNFLEFKKRMGYKILYMKTKNEKPTETQLTNFIAEMEKKKK